MNNITDDIIAKEPEKEQEEELDDDLDDEQETGGCLQQEKF